MLKLESVVNEDIAQVDQNYLALLNMVCFLLG